LAEDTLVLLPSSLVPLRVISILVDFPIDRDLDPAFGVEVTADRGTVAAGD
jgi:hypothetical protein